MVSQGRIRRADALASPNRALYLSLDLLPYEAQVTRKRVLSTTDAAARIDGRLGVDSRIWDARGMAECTTGGDPTRVDLHPEHAMSRLQIVPGTTDALSLRLERHAITAARPCRAGVTERKPYRVDGLPH